MFSSNLNIFALSGILIFITNASFAVYVFLKSRRNSVNNLWCLEALAVALYGFGVFKIGTAVSEESARFWWRIAHVGIILIPTVYYAFTESFLETKRRFEAVIVYSVAGFFLVLNLTPNFIYKMRFVFESFYYDSPPSEIYILFVAFFVVVLGLSHYRLWLASQDSRVSEVKRMQAKYFMLATLTGLIGGLTAFLPVFGLDLYPYANFMVAVYPMIMTYAILRYKLFNARTMVTEILVALLWFFLIVRTFLEVRLEDRLIDIGIFMFVFVLGVFLIRSVTEESRQKEKQEALALQLQDLASHLQEKVASQTRELRERNERLEELSKQKDEFITLIAHRLRTPLTAIKWIGDLFAKGSLGRMTKDQKVHTEKLNHVTESLIVLVDDILNVIRIEEGKYGLAFKPMDLAMIIRSVVEPSRFIANSKGIEVIEDIENIKVVPIDEEKLIIALENIVGNAVKYTSEKGRVLIALSENDRNAVVEVSDTGIGIPEKDKARIFSKFFRGKNAFQKETDGTGLGLYIARNIVRAHGGDVTFVSEEGKGSTFTITLPLENSNK